MAPLTTLSRCTTRNASMTPQGKTSPSGSRTIRGTAPCSTNIRTSSRHVCTLSCAQWSSRMAKKVFGVLSRSRQQGHTTVTDCSSPPPPTYADLSTHPQDPASCAQQLMQPT
mmetsp:Transcript_36103/g.90603  ORF Transcript_36103/g.90603 Transcript_36103/m.90603 type:complete len:112 (-) Transcript_36103:50-385(-)